jgi:RNA polymerase sigma-70 factor (ECF subfamily)
MNQEARKRGGRERSSLKQAVDPAEELEWERPVVDPDGELVSRAVAGERAAFEALLRRHYDRIHRLAWRMTGSRSEAEDVTQDVCCALVEKLASFKGEAKFTTWLIGIAVNACRDHFRRRQTQTRFHDGLEVLSNLAPQPDGRDLYRRS